MAGIVIVTWDDVLDRYRAGDTVEPLVGSSKLVVDAVDGAGLCLRQRLWRACVTPEQLALAVDVLESDRPRTGLELAELLRRHYAGGPSVTTDCSRVPNLCAVVLADMGIVPAR